MATPWTQEGLELVKEFWYCRRQWKYWRTRSCVASARYEKAMTDAAGKIVDKGFVNGSPMPSVTEVEKLLQKQKDQVQP